MKSDALTNEADLRHYLEMMIAEGSDLDARALQQKWINNNNPSVMDLQAVSFALYSFTLPLSAENFTKILERITEKNKA